MGGSPRAAIKIENKSPDRHYAIDWTQLSDLIRDGKYEAAFSLAVDPKSEDMNLVKLMGRTGKLYCLNE
jgi:hypothetical protein